MSPQLESPSINSSDGSTANANLSSSELSTSHPSNCIGHDTIDDDESSKILKTSLEQDISSAPGPIVFRRGDKTQRERDIRRLAIAFTLSESKEIRDIFVLVTKFTHTHRKGPKTTAKVIQFMDSLCGPFVLRLSEIHGKVPQAMESSSAVITEFLNLLRDLDTLLSLQIENLDEDKKRSTEILVENLIDKIKEIKKLHPLAFREHADHDSAVLGSRIDTLLDASITILDIIQGGSDLIPPPCIKPAVGLACALLKAVKTTRTNYQDMHDLSETTSEFALSIAVFLSENNIKLSRTLELGLTEFTTTLQDIVGECLQLADKSLVYHFLQQGIQANTLGELKSKLDHAIRGFQLKTQILQYSDFHCLTKFITDKMDGDIIQSLPQNPFFQGSREDFLPDIQDDTLTKIGSWVENSDSPILLLSGGAGLGKTSISHQLVYHLMDTGRLAGQIFCIQGSVMQCSLVTVIQMLAHELASMHPRAVPEIANATRLGGSSHQSLSSYVQKYILDPIQSLSLNHPLVLVLDALDECDDYQILLQAFSGVHDSTAVKIFMTSRPSIDLEECTKSMPMITRLNLKRLSRENMERYISVRFNKMQWCGAKPSKDNITQLANLADGLLIWAATSCNFIGNELQEDEPDQLLQKIISAGRAQDIASEDQLANLYHTTLLHLFGGNNIPSFLHVFQTMLVVQESMTVQTFAMTFKLGVRRTQTIHSALCALEIYENFDKGVIIPASQRFHASFLEYITQSQLSSQLNPFYIDLGLAHSKVAERCIFQIRRCKKATYEDLDIPDQYAVCQWPSHLINCVRVQHLSVSQEIESLQRIASDGINNWAPFYVLASQALSIALEGQGARRVIDKAVSFHTHSRLLFRATGVDQIEASSDFGFALWKRYDQSGSLEDLEDSISMQLSFLDSHPEPSIQRARALSRMGAALWGRFMTPKSSNQDLDKAILALYNALETYGSLDQKDDFETLLALAAATRTRFEETGTEKDLNDTIQLHKKVANMMPPDHIDPTRALNNLAICLISRFEEKNTISDLDEAISILHKILDSRPVGHPNRSSTLNNLAYSLQHRFENLGQMSDLKDAIAMNYEVLDLRPEPHRYRAQTLTNIALCLRYRFEGQGSTVDLADAISMSTEALKLRPDPHPYYPFSINRLGDVLYLRFQHQDDPEDLNEAISLFSIAVASCPELHRDYFVFLNDHGKALRTRFERTAVERDLLDAMEMQRKALGLSPPQSIEYSAVLNDVGMTLLTYYEHRQSEAILTEAIKLLRDACKLRPVSHPYRFQALKGLARALHHKFERTERPQYLDEARVLYAESVQLCLPSHPSRAIALEGLAHVAQSHIGAHDPLAALGGWMGEGVQPNLSLQPKL